MDLGLFILRVVFGLTLTAHSVQKLFGWFGAPALPARRRDGTTWVSTTAPTGCGGMPRRRRCWPGASRWPLDSIGLCRVYLGHVCGDSERSSAKRLLHSKGWL